MFANTPKVCEGLQEYDFQVNLVPTSITSYTLNKDTGKFKLNMDDTCKLTINDVDFMFKPIVSGVISTYKIRKLKGVSIKTNVFWTEIR